MEYAVTLENNRVLFVLIAIETVIGALFIGCWPIYEELSFVSIE